MKKLTKLSKRDSNLMKLPPLLAVGGMLEGMLGENFIFHKETLNHEQYVILIHLWHYDKPTRMKDIAELLLKSPSSATLHVDEMVNNGLLKRKPSNEDRRVLYISITRKGLELLEKTQLAVLEFIGKLCDDITDSELNTTIATLHKFIRKSEKLMNLDLQNILSLTNNI